MHPSMQSTTQYAVRTLQRQHESHCILPHQHYKREFQTVP